jgi:hypothetical protein
LHQVHHVVYRRSKRLDYFYLGFVFGSAAAGKSGFKGVRGFNSQVLPPSSSRGLSHLLALMQTVLLFQQTHPRRLTTKFKAGFPL